MSLPSNDTLRKMIRPWQGFVKYFPDATALVAYLSRTSNEQHNPGTEMHWDKSKSTDELDSMMNHLLDLASKGPLSQDADGVLDAVKVAWRAMANLQRLADEHGTQELLHRMLVPVTEARFVVTGDGLAIEAASAPAEGWGEPDVEAPYMAKPVEGCPCDICKERANDITAGRTR